MTRFARLAATTSAATLLLIAVGGLVRATGSGLGCPDWPGCSTDLDIHAVIESSHRVVAGVVAILMAALAVSALRARRHDRPTLVASLATAVLVVIQAGLGAVVVLLHLRAELVTLHLALALTLLGLTVYITERAVRGPQPAMAGPRALVAATVLAAGLVFGQMLLGSLVTGRGAGLAFTDFPLMEGSLVPDVSGQAEALHLAHRAGGVLVAAAVAVTTLLVFRATRSRPARRLAAAAMALVALQVGLGGLVVLSGLTPITVLLHLVIGTLLWTTALTLALTVWRLPRAAPEATAPTDAAGRPRGDLRETVQAYVALTKPRIIELLLVTTVPTMVLAERGVPSPWLVAATLIGGTLAAGSANAINCVIDRGIDGIMGRTRRRPLPRGSVTPRAALRFGVVLGAIAVGWLALTVNVLAAALAAGAILFYVVVYTLLLKRTTPQNIVIGGAAGCAPVLVAWAAVTETVALPALVLFAIVFYWTPPHFWALAMRYRGDYARAGVPMLPVVRGEAETAWQILLYTLLLVSVSLLLLPVAAMGAIYLAAAIVLGSIFIGHAVRVWRAPGEGRGPVGLFRYSISYLALLFGAIGLDSLVRVPIV